MQFSEPLPIAGPEAWEEWFGRNAEGRTVMSIAQRCGLTFPEAEARVTQEAIEAEIGWNNYQTRRKAECCPGCGVSRLDMDADEFGTSADEPSYKIERRECAICFENAEAMSDLKDELPEGDQGAGIYFAVVPRGEGEPVAPRHASAADRLSAMDPE